MPLDQNGNYTRLSGPTSWQDDRDEGLPILASRHDQDGEDMAEAISQMLPKDGRAQMTGNLNMGAYKIQNLSDAAQARYWAQAINSGKVAPENLTGRVNASILPFVGDTITQARALAAARFGVGSAPQEAVNIFGNELGRQAYKSPKAMRKAARKQYKKFQGDILDRDNLQGIRFGRHGIEEIISSSANTDKLNAVPAIPKIIKRGKLGAVRPLYKQRNDRYTGYQYIETPVNYKGKPSKAYVSIAHEQGKGPAFNNINIGQKDASPAIHHNGGAGEAINSITNKPAKNKAQFNVFDLLRVLNSPYYGGIAGGVAADNLRKERR